MNTFSVAITFISRRHTIMNAWCFIIIVLYSLLLELNAVTSEECMAESKEKHCYIESRAADRWPHTARYRYSSLGKDCVLIRWSNVCSKSKDPNNFASKRECTNACSGWA